MSSLNQKSLVIPNVANQVAVHLNELSAGLVSYVSSMPHSNDVWFTGSRVWSFVYGAQPTVLADLDILCLSLTAKMAMYKYTGWTLTGTCGKYAPVPGDQYNLTIDSGYITITADVWHNGYTIADSLLTYPEPSHAHARCAFNFNQGLVIMPNTQGW